MRHLIYLVVFLSGFAALVFETLWFRQAGLAFGNSLWSATLVLSSFMGGLALGNGLVLKFSRKLSAPLSAYVVLEVLIAVAGFIVVLLLPAIGIWLSPLFRVLMDVPTVLNFLRLAGAFVILMIPATAMGATLPVLVKAVSRRDSNYGRVLGRLYGWNTLGATAGVLAAELYVVRWLGIPGAAFLATLTGLTAVLIAMRLRKIADRDHEPQTYGLPLNLRGKRYLLVAFIAGMALLGLEVLWFRFLLLFQPGTSLVFAVMLATVLCGIALGGIITARLYSMHINVHLRIRLLAGTSALLIASSYALFPAVQSSLLLEFGTAGFEDRFVLAAIFLMLPVSVLSGVIFTALGRGLQQETDNGTRTTAWLTLANTLGAMLGSLVTGFILLPVLGIEKSFFVMIVLYGLAALLVPKAESVARISVYVRATAVTALFLLSVAVFPYGLMNNFFLGENIAKRFPGTDIVAVREGLTETAIYLEYENLGQADFYRLLTNSYSMSTTNEQSKRYMKLFVYLPVAIRPNPKSALLISYGIGNTAEALTDTDSLESIDIVDVSRDILELSGIVYPDSENHPLNDERVDVHIEDGRFFLQVTEENFDLITSEPPPPTIAGVVNLYTQEYFELIRSRLTPGGISSYWLPGHSLEEDAAKSIIKSFCNVFADCSLWSGAGLDWILVGTRNASGAPGLQDFAGQWADPKVADELRAIGVENPHQLGSLFMADANGLRQATQDVQPVVDAFPYRILLPYSGSREVPQLYAWLMNSNRAAERFAASEFIRRHWPAELIPGTLPYFAYQGLINQRYAPGIDMRAQSSPVTLRQVLTETDLQALPLWMLGSSYYEQRLVDKVAYDPRYAVAHEWGKARRAIAERRFPEALQHLEHLRTGTDQANAVGLNRLTRLITSLQTEKNTETHHN
jgi:spermidine synthase